MKRLGCVTLMFMAGCFLGCGDGGPATSSVSGKVTIDGKPAEGLQITFTPSDENKETASGTVGADGTYTLYTGVTGTPGAVVGKYKVVLTDPGDDSYMDAGPGGGEGAEPTVTGRVPAEYTSADTSPKEVEVTSGSNTINIEI